MPPRPGCQKPTPLPAVPVRKRVARLRPAGSDAAGCGPAEGCVSVESGWMPFYTMCVALPGSSEGTNNVPYARVTRGYPPDHRAFREQGVCLTPVLALRERT